MRERGRTRERERKKEALREGRDERESCVLEDVFWVLAIKQIEDP